MKGMGGRGETKRFPPLRPSDYVGLRFGVNRWTTGVELERAKGFEPSTATLARWSSTTELRSLFIIDNLI